MRPSAAVIDKLPQFDGASWRVGEDTIVNVVEGYTIDLPFPVPLRVLVGGDSMYGLVSDPRVTYFCSKLNTWSGLERSFAGGSGSGSKLAGMGPLFELSVTTVPTLNFMT